MTISAQQISSDPGPTVSEDPINGLLLIPGFNPTTVFVKPYTPPGGTEIPVFGLAAVGKFFIQGLEWKSSATTAMFITFQFLPNIKKVDCGTLPTSPVYGPNNLNQDLCIVATSPRTYNFTVEFNSGALHDPQIIVTPPSVPDPDPR